MQKITLDLVPGKKMPSLNASQFDDGRAYHIDLTENRAPYTLDGTETISVIIRKCDNTLVSMDIANTFADKSYIEFEVVEQMTACSGFNYGEIILEKNGDRLGSLNFYLVVEAAPDENGITSQSEIKNLERQVHDIVAEELADNGAKETGYDNTESGLEATNVQDAIDEVNDKIENIPSVDAYTKEQSDQKYATKTALQDVANEVSGKASASDLQTVSNDVTSLKNDVYGITTETVLELTADKYYNTADVISSGDTTYNPSSANPFEGTYCVKKAVYVGDHYEIVGVGGSNAVGLYVLTGTGSRVISYRAIGDRQTPVILDITENGYLYVNLFNYNSNTDKVTLTTHTIGFEDEINDLKDITEDLSNETTGEKTDTEQTLTPNKYINMTEVFRDGATTFVGYQNAYSGCYCATIKVQANEIYTLYGAGSGNAMGLYVLTDVDGLVLSSVKMGSRDFPTVVNINQSGYLYVNLTYYDSNTDKIVKTVYDNGIVPSIKDLNLTLPFFGKKIVNFGDSIIGQRRPPFDVSTVLADLTGATVYNCGFGGCRMAKHNLANYDAFSMYRLAYAIAHNDWSVQDAADFSQLPTYFAETLSLLKTIDFSKVDSITIGYGTNDLTGDVGLDDNNDPDNTNYFGGALRYSLDLLMSAFPNLKVFVCGQTYRFWSSGGVFTEDSDTYTNANSNTLIDFVDKTKAISHDYHLQFIDNYFDLGINKLNRSNWFLANDGTHHNFKGAHLIAEHIARLMF